MSITTITPNFLPIVQWIPLKGVFDQWIPLKGVFDQWMPLKRVFDPCQQLVCTNFIKHLCHSLHANITVLPPVEEMGSNGAIGRNQ